MSRINFPFLSFPLIDVLALCWYIAVYSIYNAAQTFILEKETKVREGLRMQGVGNCTLVASWFASLGLQYFAMALLMAIASKVSLFENGSFILLLLGYWLSLVSFMACAFAVHTLFNKAKTGGLFMIVVFAGGFPLFESWSLMGRCQNDAGDECANACYRR